VTACPTCGVDPDERFAFLNERVTYWMSAYRGQRELSRELARKLTAKEQQK
jgi:hypothetical protein